jgi:uncharacterized coiled-coil protein SlyX
VYYESGGSFMKIYQSEIESGLSDLIQNNTVAYCAQANLHKGSIEAAKVVINDADVLEKIVAQNKDQVDLYYLESVLVSTGWNKNDDVFSAQETWAARNTPEDKQFNFMHNEDDIIGHITGSYVVDRDGSRLNSESTAPDQFDIVTQAVLYTSWSGEEKRERMKKIIAEIEEGQWFVSMECLFPAFDYALQTAEGETKIIERNEASAFLTKHLRAYGGEGIYENYRIGRLLRNLAFSGKGLVSKPANPRSIILDKNDLFDESKSQILTISSVKESNMSDLDKQIEDLRTELAEAKAANEALKEKVVAEQRSEFESKIQELEATIAEQAEALTAKDATINEQAEAIKHGEKDMKEKMEELREMKKKEGMMKRKAQLEEAGLDAEEASATVESFDGVNDEAFEAVVAVMKKKYADMHGDKDKKDKEEKDAKAEIEEELDPAEASEEVLEEAEASEEVAVAEVEPEVDPAESLRSVASEWIGSFLQSTPKNK